MVAALVFFFANTLPISIVIALTEGKSSRKVWSECYFWSFPYYLVGAAAVGLVGIVNRSAGWETSLLVLPLIYWVYRSYRLYLGRLEAEKERVEVEKRHVEQIASLNMRTIEALALAIEAKDHTTHTHLQRVRTYAVAVAKELNLPEGEIEALRAAALLHDIGKLAVPEQIINKPGKLTPEEFEKMKVHPLVGAEILERVAFPYPVAPDCAVASRALGRNGISRRIERAKTFPSARGFSRRSIVWMLWPLTGSTGPRCRWTRRWRKSKRKSGTLVRSASRRDSRKPLCGIGAHGADVGGHREPRRGLSKTVRWNADWRPPPDSNAPIPPTARWITPTS